MIRHSTANTQEEVRRIYIGAHFDDIRGPCGENVLYSSAHFQPRQCCSAEEEIFCSNTQTLHNALTVFPK